MAATQIKLFKKKKGDQMAVKVRARNRWRRILQLIMVTGNKSVRGLGM